MKVRVGEMEKHNWIAKFGMRVCKHCGIVRRRDGKNKACPGKVRVELRENRIRAASTGGPET